MRQQLPAASPLALRALAGAIAPTVLGHHGVHGAAVAALSEVFGTRALVLTDSGTSALVMALRLVGGDGTTVALPAYGCANLTAAVVFTGVRVRLYDVDPITLGVDLDSLRRVLSEGVAAVVVAHLYGFACDVPAVSELAASFGAVVVEDAAQAGGGTLNGRPLGSFGPLAVLSFGRGKGMTASGGGALLATGEPWAGRLMEVGAHLTSGRRGARDLALGLAQWLLGRPSLYALPAGIPSLRLGEMVYKPASEPTGISGASAALLIPALRGAAGETRTRRRNALRLQVVLGEGGLRAPVGMSGSLPGYLRLPVLARPQREADPRLGILRAYPLTLQQHPELRPLLLPATEALPGAAFLRDALLTVPVHSLLREVDIGRIRRWAVKSA